jgi:hypothetical protein
MLSSLSTPERPRIEPQTNVAYTDVANKGTLSAAASLRLHWPEYLMEAGESSLYIFSACAVIRGREPMFLAIPGADAGGTPFL